MAGEYGAYYGKEHDPTPEALERMMRHAYVPPPDDPPPERQLVGWGAPGPPRTARQRPNERARWVCHGERTHDTGCWTFVLRAHGRQRGVPPWTASLELWWRPVDAHGQSLTLTWRRAGYATPYDAACGAEDALQALLRSVHPCVFGQLPPHPILAP